MNMKVGMKYLALIAELIVFAVVDIVLYVLAEKPLTDTSMCSFIILNVGFVVTIIAPMLVPQSESHMIFSNTVGFITTSYAVLEIILACLFIFVSDNLVIGILVQAVALVACIVLCILEVATDREIAQYETKTVEYRENYMSDMRNNMKESLKNANPELTPMVEKAHDEVMSMPMKMKESTIEMDAVIRDLTEQILQATLAGNRDRLEDLCSILSSKIIERNSVFRGH